VSSSIRKGQTGHIIYTIMWQFDVGEISYAERERLIRALAINLMEQDGDFNSEVTESTIEFLTWKGRNGEGSNSVRMQGQSREAEPGRALGGWFPR